MLLDELVEMLGRVRSAPACEWAWRTDAESWPDGLDGVPHELSELWYAQRGVQAFGQARLTVQHAADATFPRPGVAACHLAPGTSSARVLP